MKEVLLSLVPAVFAIKGVAVYGVIVVCVICFILHAHVAAYTTLVVVAAAASGFKGRNRMQVMSCVQGGKKRFNVTTNLSQFSSIR